MTEAEWLASEDPAARKAASRVNFYGPVSCLGTRCWVWTGAICGRTGYGNLRLDGKTVLAHRAVYHWLVGEIPIGRDIDHLCRCRSCVNPSHMEPVTERINTIRGEGPTAINARKTHCDYGHPFDDLNTYTDKRGRRYCKECEREKVRRRRKRRKGGAV